MVSPNFKADFLISISFNTVIEIPRDISSDVFQIQTLISHPALSCVQTPNNTGLGSQIGWSDSDPGKMPTYARL